jgi:hypothetical protein
MGTTPSLVVIPFNFQQKNKISTYIWPRNRFCILINISISGEGIKISSDIDELFCHVDQEGASYVIQQYIDKPLLLDSQRKFDIR